MPIKCLIGGVLQVLNNPKQSKCDYILNFIIMKKLFFPILATCLILISCSKEINDTQVNTEKYNELELQTFNKLVNTGINKRDVENLLDNVVIPKKYLEIPVYPNYKRPRGFWMLDTGGGGGNNGPISDHCQSGGRDCKTGRNIAHVIDPVEEIVFFNGTDRGTIVDSEMKYPEGNLYTQYLTIIYQDDED
jgi:hypothetical protein